MVGALLLIVLGVLLLLNNVYPGQFPFSRTWPIILIAVGLAKVFEYAFPRTTGREEGSGE